MVMLGAHNRDSRFMASFVLNSGCAIARKIFGGHEGDKGFHEMWSAIGNPERGFNSFTESPQKFRETFILRKLVVRLQESIFLSSIYVKYDL